MHLLKEPILINHLRLANRLVMPPMATAKAEDGQVTKALLEYYDEKSRGGYIGLIITEHSYVNKQGLAHGGQLSLSRDSDIAGLRELVQTIHANNTPCMAQISHAGSAADPALTGSPAISASPVLPEGNAQKGSVPPEEMNLEQINDLVRDFARAAGRAKDAGFDGVEIHSAHGYLLNQFYSPLTNQRSDEYGASTMEGRLRLHIEIIKAVREVVGPDYPIALRLGGCDYQEGGSTLEDSVAAALLLEKNGVDMLDISGGMNGYRIQGNQSQGYFSPMTELIKKEASLPVLLTGGIVDPEAAERLLERETADLIGVGRALLQDSEWAKKCMG